MFKRAFFIVLSSLVLFGCIAPCFSLAVSAPFTFESSMVQPTQDSNKLYYVLANNANDGIVIQISSNFVPLMDPYSPGLFYAGGYGFEFECMLTQSGTYFVDVTVFDLATGNIILNKSETKTNRVHITIDFAITGFNGSAYAYSLYGAPLSSNSFQHVDPFVNWFDPNNPPPGPGPDPVDPTEVIRSRIPRPYGNAVTYYIADHLYLYAIYMGVPQQFEEQGIINTSLDPATYEGDNINIYEVYFTGSGSTLNFTVLNHAKYSYNCTVTKYDVVDGSFVSSSSHAMTVATDADHPSTNTFSISLSDPSTYGIYQSGLFARHTSISYPELRISWSDTIDYSLDFFVIRSGITTLVEGMAQVIGGIGTANSTLSTISSTSSSILSAINNFYTLVSDNFTWFKSTYFNTITNKWDITKNQLDYIILLLEGDGTQTTLPIDESVAAGVDDYVSNENQYMEGFSDAAGDVSSVFNEASSQLSNTSSGFAFVKMIFETFILQLPMTYIIIFFSLTFGIIVLIIGRKVGG